MNKKETSKAFRKFILTGTAAAAGLTALTAGFMRAFALSRSFPMHLAGPKREEGPNPVSDFINPGRKWVRKEASPVSVVNRDGMRLCGLFVPAIQAGSHRYVILCHGYRNDCTEMGTYAQHFHRRGYACLLPDARGHGESEGKYIGMGWQERLDVLEWANLLCRKDPKAQIVLMGVSMGAATVMMTSGENLPSNIKAIVEDCGYTSVWEEFSAQIRHYFHLPVFPFLYVSSMASKLRYGFSFGEASAIRQVAKCNRPLLFIHGAKDTFVPFYMLNKLYHAAGGEREKLVVDKAGHALCCATNPQVYWKKVDAFLDKYII